MGRPFREYLDGSKVYCCKSCRAHFAAAECLVSKAFHCKSGAAYLFSTTVNVVPGPKEERLLTTGLHIVADIFCSGCSTYCGWRYEMAYEKSQKYKEGKYILERALVVDVCCNDDNDDGSDATAAAAGEEELCDSDDDDEEY